MKNLLLILLVGLAIEANSQLTTYRTYYDELTRTKLHEEWTAKPSPNLARGVKHGLYKEFDAAGNLIREMQYADGKQNGYSKTYYFIPDPQQRPCYGKLIGDFNFKNGQRHGTQKDYRCDQGQMSLAKQTEYNEGQILSEVSYYHNGAKEYEKRYNGLNKEWNKGGQLIAEYNLVNGIESGLKVLYHDNGQVKIKGEMSDGNYSGEWIAYNENGSVLSKFTKHPNTYYFLKLQSYSKDGVLKETVDHREGLHFVTKYDSTTGNKIFEEYRKYVSESKYDLVRQKNLFYPSGELKTDFRYDDEGYYISITIYNQEGQRIGGGDCNSNAYPTGSWTIFRNEYGDFLFGPSSATRYYEIEFIGDDFKIGEVKEFDINGTFLGEGSLSSLGGFELVESGYWKYYYPDGKINQEGEYQNGRKHGLWRHFYEDGTIKKEGSYNFNQPNGNWNIYDSSGKLDSVYRYSGGKIYSKKKAD